MAGKKAVMTPAQIGAAGFVVESYYVTGASLDVRQRSWMVRRLGHAHGVLDRYRTRYEAVADLHEHLTHPDGRFYRAPWAR